MPADHFYVDSPFILFQYIAYYLSAWIGIIGIGLRGDVAHGYLQYLFKVKHVVVFTLKRPEEEIRYLADQRLVTKAV